MATLSMTSLSCIISIACPERQFKCDNSLAPSFNNCIPFECVCEEGGAAIRDCPEWEDEGMPLCGGGGAGNMLI